MTKYNKNLQSFKRTENHSDFEGTRRIIALAGSDSMYM